MITRYEIALSNIQTGESYLVQYSPRVSRPGVLAAARYLGPSIMRVAGIGEDDVLTWTTKPRPTMHLNHIWQVGFTGRTQLDARTSPLKFVADA